MDKKDCCVETIEEQVVHLLHELSNPLTIATSLVEIMINNSEINKLEEVHENLKRITVTVDKLKQIKEPVK